MKTTKTTVQERLMVGQEGYESIIMQIWLTWCTERSKNRQSLQKVLVCKPLFNWWMREMQILETEFLAETRPFDCPVHAQKMYFEWVKDIFLIFSKPLLKQATKRDK